MFNYFPDTTIGLALKLNSYSDAEHFLNSSAVSCSVSIQTPRHCSAIKYSCRSFLGDQENSCVMRLKLNCFQLMERHCSWDGILIFIYRIDAHDLKNGNAHERRLGQ